MRYGWRGAIVAGIVLAAPAAAPPAGAQTGGVYGLSWSTLDTGGGTSAGGAYLLHGSAGRPTLSPLAGGAYTVWSGFVQAPPAGQVGVWEPLPAPERYLSLPPVPNPFSSSVAFRVDLPGAGRISVSVYDVAGRLVNRLIDETRTAGRHTVFWDGRDAEGRPVSAGIYLVRARAGDRETTHRLVRLQ